MKDRFFFAVGLGIFIPFVIVMIIELVYWIRTGQLGLLTPLFERLLIVLVIIFFIVGLILYPEDG